MGTKAIGGKRCPHMKKKYLPILGIIWLTALASFIWGAAMVYYDIFPGSVS